jgi:thioredoxin-dependent peroxiredoxin
MSLQIGDIIPQFSLQDQDGNLFDVNTIIGKKKLVVFFYPQDGSHGCTAEACYFRDLTELFDEADARIIGISGQSVESHKNFAEKFKLNYPILSDEGDTVRKLFGVPSQYFGLVPGRVTYIADRQSKIVHVFNSSVNPERHVDEALKACLILKKTENAGAAE